MIEARADVILPVPAHEAFAAATDLADADWLPAVRGLRHIGGPVSGVGARYEVEAGIVGRYMQGILVCRVHDAPEHAVFELEEGIELSINVLTKDVAGGCNLELCATYSVGGPFSSAVERASAGPARREVARAVEQFAARFGRK